MQTIRVYSRTGGLAASFTGIDAERKMREHFGGEPSGQFYLVLR